MSSILIQNGSPFLSIHAPSPKNPGLRNHILFGLCGFFLFEISAQAAGQKKPELPFDGRKVVAIAPVENIQIEMPDQSFHDFGADYQASLTAQLMDSGRYLVADPIPVDGANKTGIRSTPTPEYSWDGRF